MVQRSFEHETGFVSWETKETMLPPSTNYLHIEGIFFLAFSMLSMIFGHISFVLDSSRLSVLFFSVQKCHCNKTHKKCFVRLSWSFFGSFILLDVFTPHEGSAHGAN